jgi:uncharacterized Fe-S cluster protein YjdI
MDSEKIVKEYTNGEVTIVWKPSICIHSKLCVTGLPTVFDFDARPWVNAQGGTTEQIIEQVQKCPSGALSYFKNNKTAPEETLSVENERIIEITPNGPLMVYGNIVIKHSDGTESHHEHRVTAFCRCGASHNKPYCDGSHQKIAFTG